VLVIIVAVGALLITKPWQSPGRPSAKPSQSASLFDVDPPPVVGRCYDYDFGAFSKSTVHADPVSCEGPHTAYTVAVVPSTGIALPYDNDDNAAAAAVARCQGPVQDLLSVGPGVEFSGLLASVFEPDQYQLARGQRWLRCDVVEVSPYHLKTLPATLAGLLVSGPDLRDAFCVRPTEWLSNVDHDPTVEGWSNKADCSEAGAVVAVVATPAAPTGTPWPGAASASAATARACSEVSQRFPGLELRPVPQSETAWSTLALCVADLSAYQRWVTHGKRLADAAPISTPSA
jgi:hypothetical protein